MQKDNFQLSTINYQLFRERLSLILIALLPLHALLVTSLTKVLKGPGNPPWSVVSVWKELLLLALLGIALWELWQKSREQKSWKNILQFDGIDAVILAFISLAFLVTLDEFHSVKAVLLGVKYDLIPLIIVLVLRRVEWSKAFSTKALQVVLGVGVTVAVHGLFTLFLPMQFFVALGYSDLHSLYLPGDSLAAFQQIGASGVRRIQSTLSGPNQFGLWLLLPFSISLLGFIRCIQSDDNFFLRVLNIAQATRAALLTYATLVALFSAGILLSFSRAAWLAALLIVILAVFMRYSNAKAQRYVVRLIAPIIFGFAILAIVAPNVVFRIDSTRDHVLKPLMGIQKMVQHPFGSGLGAAGPAHNRISDACVFLPEGADADWAANRADLCVFAGDTQVQPTDRLCNCPFVTENWYIQIGVELGILGLLLFCYLVYLLTRQLRTAKDEAHTAVLFAFFGVSIAGMFLHSWEEAAVAYTLWLLLAVQLRAEEPDSLLT